MRGYTNKKDQTNHPKKQCCANYTNDVTFKKL